MKTTSENEAFDQLLPPQDPKDRRSSYSKTIKKVDELLKDIALRNKCKRVLGWGYDLKPNHFYIRESEERDDGLILLLEDLGLLKADWTGLAKNQKHRSIGNRLITIVIDGSKAIEFFNRINGKKSKIHKDALELVAHQLADGKSADNFFEILENCGIPKTLFQYNESYPIDNEWLIAYDIMKLYSSSSNQEDLSVVFQIIEEAARPIMFGGDEEGSREFQDQVSGYIKNIGYCFDDNGKIVKATKKLLKDLANRQAQRKKASGKLTKEKTIVKIPIPKNITKWENIEMRLSGENGLGNIMIKILGNDDFEHKTDFEKLGFGKTKPVLEAKKSWINFLYVLAMNNGKFPMREYLSKSQKKERDKRNQWKKEVKENFILAFGINADPIKWNRKEQSYIARLKIIPPMRDRIDMEYIDEIDEEIKRQQIVPVKRKK